MSYRRRALQERQHSRRLQEEAVTFSCARWAQQHAGKSVGFEKGIELVFDKVGQARDRAKPGMLEGSRSIKSDRSLLHASVRLSDPPTLGRYTAPLPAGTLTTTASGGVPFQRSTASKRC